jgi:hypothetical protein
MIMAATGASPLGALVGGLLGETLGVHAGVAIGAFGMQLGFLVLLLSPVRQLRDVPRQRQ